MNDYNINAFSSDEDERRPRIFRERQDYFRQYDENDFISRFRISPRTAEMLLEQIEDTISFPSERNNALSASQQLLLTLNFYANGSFLRVTGDFMGVSTPTACRTVSRVSRAIASLRPRYIKMPTQEEIVETRGAFYNIARFPRCIGAIDCTHIKIQSPGGPNAEIFRNRKNFFSYNVQTIVDANYQIRDIVARWPGSTHDAHILRNSRVFGLFENGHFGNSVLVGDSGYFQKPYIMTPLREVHTEAEALYNESQIRTRNVVERTYGIWKRRFPALAMGLRLTQETTQAVIVATAVLHNIACRQNDEVPVVGREQEDAINFINNVPVHPPDNLLHNDVRRNLIENYFTRL